VQVGTPREVYTRPVNRFVAEFLGSSSARPDEPWSPVKQ
jgi:ABC-type sugar transport system ATPase subunit